MGVSHKYRKTPKYRLIHGAKKRKRQKNLTYDLKMADIQIPEKCPVLGIPLDLRGLGGDYSPSLDRKNPELGYVKDNVWVISKKANSMKSNATVSELKEFASWVNNNF